MKKLVITGYYEHAKPLLAIKAVRQAANMTLAPAKSIIDRALAGETVGFEVAEDKAAKWADTLSRLGWIIAIDDAVFDAGPVAPPDWYARLKGDVEVLRHLPPRDTRLGMLVDERACELRTGDELFVLFHENLRLGAIVLEVERGKAGTLVLVATDGGDDADFLQQLFAEGQRVDVLGPQKDQEELH